MSVWAAPQLFTEGWLNMQIVLHTKYCSKYSNLTILIKTGISARTKWKVYLYGYITSQSQFHQLHPTNIGHPYITGLQPVRYIPGGTYGMDVSCGLHLTNNLYLLFVSCISHTVHCHGWKCEEILLLFLLLLLLLLRENVILRTSTWSFPLQSRLYVPHVHVWLCLASQWKLTDVEHNTP